MSPELKRIYVALKRANPKLYRDAIHSAEAVTLTHNLGLKVADDVEAAVVLMVAKAAGIEA